MIKAVPADPIMLTGMTDCLAIAIENAVVEWDDSLDGFLEKFIASGLAESFANQEPFVTTGCTGEELVAMVNEHVSGIPQSVRVNNSSLAYSIYYWIGYALALIIAEKGVSLQKILAKIPPEKWLSIYPIYHEYGDELLVDKLLEMMNQTPGV